MGGVSSQRPTWRLVSILHRTLLIQGSRALPLTSILPAPTHTLHSCPLWARTQCERAFPDFMQSRSPPIPRSTGGAEMGRLGGGKTTVKGWVK